MLRRGRVRVQVFEMEQGFCAIECSGLYRIATIYSAPKIVPRPVAYGDGLGNLYQVLPDSLRRWTRAACAVKPFDHHYPEALAFQQVFRRVL